ncbi:glycosyltransferase family 39 protein [Defluviimonas sp. SAOS-178_SWC]|uniref:glycosyltransferase family 39 protein n=1 Tax=Defluviimonas sp. SAOS-178_SWC TaxID=3121287 RepID=UPI003221A6F3
MSKENSVVGSWPLWVALIAVAASLLLRLYGLDLRSISHPEVYVPGIPLPPDISVPPARLTFGDVVWMHFHDEPHPMGWYVAMFGWTRIAGVSEWALRFPSAVLGAATVWVAFIVGRRAYGPGAGALAAVLLALHGFHLFWSQVARMYVAGALWGLVSSALLLAFVYGLRRRGWIGAGYVASLVAGAQTIEFMWPVIGMQIVWAVLVLPQAASFRASDIFRCRFAGAHPAIQLQAVAVMLSAPELLHSAYRMRPGAVEEQGLPFLAEYASFGFLFGHDFAAIPTPVIPVAAAAALLVIAVGFLVWAMRVPAECPRPAPVGNDLPRWLPIVIAVGMTALMVWLALIAHRRNAALLVLSAGPVLALTLPALAGAVQAGLGRWPKVEAWRSRVAGPRLLIWLLGVAAPVILFILSAKVAILATRAFLVFVPFLVILVAGAAAGIGSLWPRRAAVALLLILFAASVPYSFKKPGSPRDYKTLVAAMQGDMRADDLVFVLDKRWEEAPLFYYLPDARYVTTDFAAALLQDPSARVWLVTWPSPFHPVIDDERRKALSGYERVAEVTSLRASAELFVPPAKE